MAQDFRPPRPPGGAAPERPQQPPDAPAVPPMPRVTEAPPKTARHTYCRVTPGVLLDLTEWPDGTITARILELADRPQRLG